MGVTGVTEEITKFIVSSRFDDYPEKTVNYTKDLGLCFLGASLWGSTLSGAELIIRLVRQMGGSPEVGVIGAGFKAPVVNAVLANGTSDHAAELEGNILPEYVNPMTLWPVVLALGEKLKARGQEVIEAFIVGQEVQSRIGRGCIAGFNNTGLFSLSHFGSFGAAAAAAKLLKLNVEQVRVALSIAASSTSGLFRQAGTMMHYLEAGLACRNGVMAAVLAKEGFIADKDILDDVPGRLNGYCTAYSRDVDVDSILRGVGKPPFRVDETGSKLYPCCDLQQRIIYGTSELVKRKNIKYEDVESVTVEGNLSLKALLDRPEPANFEDCRFSIYHGIAAALVDIDVSHHSFSDEKAADPRFVRTRRKVKLLVHPGWDTGLQAGVNIVTVRLKNGTEHKAECRKFGGGTEQRVSRERAMAKYREYAAEVLTPEQIDQPAKLMLELEKLRDVSELMRLLTFVGKA